MTWCKAVVAIDEDSPMTTTTQLQHPRLGVPQRPFCRNVTDTVLGGVCSGIACRLGLRTRHVRIATALLSLLFGVGLIGYMVLWTATRRDGEDAPIAKRLERERRTSSVVFWLLAAVLAVLLIISRLDFAILSPYAWTVLLSFVFAVAIWRGSSVSERAHLEDIAQALPVLGVASGRGWRAVVWRVIPATVLIVAGLQILRRVGGVWGAAVPALVGGVVLVIGILVMLAPWWLQTVRDLSSERRVRVRAEERAALVTHVHDSVLQTLILIERSAGDPTTVRRLARAQERELRSWLFAPELIGAAARQGETFASQLRAIQHDIERDYGVRVDLVVVGDTPVQM
jgi:phage shock protein PspC (stress-responsive transcriptional regulator)